PRHPSEHCRDSISQQLRPLRRLRRHLPIAWGGVLPPPPRSKSTTAAPAGFAGHLPNKWGGVFARHVPIAWGGVSKGQPLCPASPATSPRPLRPASPATSPLHGEEVLAAKEVRESSGCEAHAP